MAISASQNCEPIFPRIWDAEEENLPANYAYESMQTYDPTCCRGQQEPQQAEKEHDQSSENQGVSEEAKPRKSRDEQPLLSSLLYRGEELESYCQKGQALEYLGTITKEMLSLRPENQWTRKPSAVKMPFDLTVNKLPVFTGEQWIPNIETWLNWVANKAKFYRWSSAETFRAAKVALRGAARQWFNRHHMELTSWPALFSGLLKTFGERKLYPNDYLCLTCKEKQADPWKICEHLLEMYDIEINDGESSSADAESVRVRKYSTKNYMQLWDHALKCENDADCQLADCQRMKEIQEHCAERFGGKCKRYCGIRARHSIIYFRHMNYCASQDCPLNHTPGDDRNSPYF